MKKIIIFLLCMILVESVSGVKIGINPSEIYFNGVVDERVCKNISVMSESYYLIGEDRWTKSLLINKRDIVQYNKNAETLGIKFEYQENLIVNGKKETEICFSASEPGEYNGALIYRAEDSVAGVGIWIYANIAKEDENYLEIIIFSIPTLLLGFLIVLLFIKKQRKRCC